LTGQPAVSLVARGSDDRALGPRWAVAAAPGADAPALRVWRADEEIEPIQARVRLQAFPAPRPEPLPLGARGGTLAPGEARAFSLPGGSKSIRIAIAPGVVALLSGDGTMSRDVVAARGESRVER